MFTTEHNTTQHNTTQHNTTQYNTIQYNTIQYNTIQYNTRTRWVDVYKKYKSFLENKLVYLREEVNSEHWPEIDTTPLSCCHTGRTKFHCDGDTRNSTSPPFVAPGMIPPQHHLPPPSHHPPTSRLGFTRQTGLQYNRIWGHTYAAIRFESFRRVEIMS